MLSSTTDVSSDSFEEVVSKHRLVVLHFRASWNEYDKQMDSVFEEIESEHAGRIFFGSVDTDDQNHWQRCKQLRLLNLLAIVSFANGEHMETLIGVRTKEEMSKKIEEWWVAARAL